MKNKIKNIMNPGNHPYLKLLLLSLLLQTILILILILICKHIVDYWVELVLICLFLETIFNIFLAIKWMKNLKWKLIAIFLMPTNYTWLLFILYIFFAFYLFLGILGNISKIIRRY